MAANNGPDNRLIDRHAKGAIMCEFARNCLSPQVGDEIPYRKSKYRELLSRGYHAVIIGTSGGYADTLEFGGSMDADSIQKILGKGMLDIVVNEADKVVRVAQEVEPIKGRKFMISIRELPGEFCRWREAP